MLINAYDTTVGKVIRASHHVDEVIKTLHLTNNLSPTKKDKVYVITHATNVPFSTIAFPITLQTHTRQTITVYDERPYRDKQNRVTNQNDLTIMRLAAFLQQDVAELNFSPVKLSRNMVTKAFSDALTQRLTMRGGLDIVESSTLKVLIGYYVVCLQENPNNDLVFVVENVLRNVYGMEKDFVLGVIADLPHLSKLEDLLSEIRKNPVLYKLKGMGLKDFIAVVGGLAFTGLGKQVFEAASEASCLLTAFVYGAARFRALNKTPLGMALDPKYNKGILDTFLKNIDYTYDLNG